MDISYKAIHVFAVIAVLLCGVIDLVVAASVTTNPHNLKERTGGHIECEACHLSIAVESEPDSGIYHYPVTKDYKVDFNTMCLTCHDDNNVSHIVGVNPEAAIPADLPLDENQLISCLTCHYMHGSLASDRAMASTSMLGQIFNQNEIHKSYLLRRSNVNGELCRACHSE